MKRDAHTFGTGFLDNDPKKKTAASATVARSGDTSLVRMAINGVAGNCGLVVAVANEAGGGSRKVGTEQ